MNGLDLTAVVLAVIGGISSYVTPKLLTRRERKKAAEEATDVSWVNINKAIVVERDKLQQDLADQDKAHAKAMADQAEANTKALAAQAERYDQQIKTLSDRLMECQGRVGSLYDELRRRPQGT